MSKFLIFLFFLSSLQLMAKVKVEDVYLEKKFAGYLITTQFFKTVLIMPNKLESQKNDANIVRGGWFKDIVLNGSVNLLGKGIAPDGTLRYGLAQIFEPLVELPKDRKEVILPGVGRGVIDDKGILKITELFPWRSTVTRIGKNKENVKISFLQDCDNSKKELNYKMRIDCIFSDTALIEIQGVFMNLCEKTLKARVSPTAIFNNSNPDLKPWIVVPYQRSRLVDNKRITYIDSTPIPIKDFRNYHEFVQERLSKAKRWIAIGGLEQQGNLAFLSKAVIEKVVFWKTENCFSVFPYIDLEAKPRQRVEWTWNFIVGRGMDTINCVAENGIFGSTLKKDDNKRYKCYIQFMPVDSAKGMFIDVYLKSARGHMLSLKTYKTFGMSPLKPESITMKLPARISANERYLLRLETFKNDVLVLTAEQWLFPE